MRWIYKRIDNYILNFSIKIDFSIFAKFNNFIKIFIFNSHSFLFIKTNQSLLPLLPPFFLVESVGIGVTSSILPILIPFLAKDLKTAYPPGPGAHVLTPP